MTEQILQTGGINLDPSQNPVERNLYQEAINAIGIIPEEKFPEIDQFEGDLKYGSVEKYVEMPSGEAISQAGFLKSYAIVANEMGRNAIQILKTQHSLEELRNERDELEKNVNAKRQADQNEQELIPQAKDTQTSTILEAVDTYIKRHIVRLSETHDADELKLLGYNLAIMNLEHEERVDETERLWHENADAIQQHVDIMQFARSNAQNPKIIEKYKDIATNDHERAVLIALDLKYAMSNNTIPQVVTIHDMDNNLGIHREYETGKPGHAIGNLLGELDNIHETPMSQRLPLMDGLERHHKLGDLAKQLLMNVGRQVPLFNDVRTVAELTHSNDIPFTILTANMGSVARGLVSEINTGEIGVIGLEPDSKPTYDKPLYLTQLVAKSGAIVLFSDDGDPKSADVIKRGAVSQNIPLALQDLVFFASREPDIYKKAYLFQQTLEEVGVLYASNHYQETTDGPIGYQGTQRTLEIIQAWKEIKLKEKNNN